MNARLGLAVFLFIAGCGRSEVSPPSPVLAAETEPSAGGVPAGWVEETPSSSMRVAQFRLPGESGDAELVVYAFAGGGGTVEANLERWMGQFEQADGGPSAAVAEASREVLGDVTIHRLELGGTYVAETAPGSGARLSEPDWRLIGAVIEAPGGQRFVKCVGPAATVARWRTSVDAYLRTVRP
jgi:hypothetical protein